MTHSQIVPRETPLCVRHFFQFVQQIQNYDEENSTEGAGTPEVLRDDSPSAREVLGLATRVQPRRAAKRVVNYAEESPINEAPAKQKRGNNCADDLYDLEEPPTKRKRSNDGANDHYDLKTFARMAKLARTANGIPNNNILQDRDMNKQTWKELVAELWWGVHRVVTLNRREKSCDFGPRPWTCVWCQDHAMKLAAQRQNGSMVRKNGTAPVAPMLPRTKGPWPSIEVDWRGVNIPKDSLLQIGSMSFVVDTCDEIMVLMV